MTGFCSLLAWFVILFMNRGLKQVGENWFCHLKALGINRGHLRQGFGTRC